MTAQRRNYANNRGGRNQERYTEVNDPGYRRSEGEGNNTYRDQYDGEEDLGEGYGSQYNEMAAGNYRNGWEYGYGNPGNQQQRSMQSNRSNGNDRNWREGGEDDAGYTDYESERYYAAMDQDGYPGRRNERQDDDFEQDGRSRSNNYDGNHRGYYDDGERENYNGNRERRSRNDRNDEDRPGRYRGYGAEESRSRNYGKDHQQTGRMPYADRFGERGVNENRSYHDGGRYQEQNRNDRRNSYNSDGRSDPGGWGGYASNRQHQERGYQQEEDDRYQRQRRRGFASTNRDNVPRREDQASHAQQQGWDNRDDITRGYGGGSRRGGYGSNEPNNERNSGARRERSENRW